LRSFPSKPLRVQLAVGEQPPGGGSLCCGDLVGTQSGQQRSKALQLICLNNGAFSRNAQLADRISYNFRNGATDWACCESVLAHPHSSKMPMRGVVLVLDYPKGRKATSETGWPVNSPRLPPANWVPRLPPAHENRKCLLRAANFSGLGRILGKDNRALPIHFQ
jgi:hypothetical protein